MGFCDPSDPTCGVIESSDPATGEPILAQSTDPLMGDPLIPDEAGNVCLASMFVDGQCPPASPIDPSLLYAGPGYNIKNVTPGAPLTPAQLTAQQVAAQAALLKMVPAVSSAALTAAQLAAGLTTGTIARVATTVCPSGYRSSTGACVQSSGQWFSFATNSQVMTFGAVILAAIIIVPALSGGGRRRR